MMLNIKNFCINTNWFRRLVGSRRRALILAISVFLVAPIIYSAVVELDNTRPYGHIGSPVVYPPNLSVSGGMLYSTRFDADQYTGDVVARVISKTGVISQDVFDENDLVTSDNSTWRAHENLPVHGSRIIFTSKTADGSTTGHEFRWDSLDSDLQVELGFAGEFVSQGIDLLNWVRGDADNEGAAVGNLRDRNAFDPAGDVVHYVLGDITHSSVQYVGPPFNVFWDEGIYPGYTAFRIANIGREPMLYVGANDGMLHAFRASDGVELFAYVPQAVLSNLAYLSNQAYIQSYYVDGTPTIGDAFGEFPECPVGPDDCWRTILVGGLNSGGQAIYALDVTDPEPLDEAEAKDMALWEFNDPDLDLGDTFSRPVITRLSDGTWVAIFGSGVHDSGVSKAALYIVNIEDGELIQKIVVNPASSIPPNGLFSPEFTDVDYDGNVDFVYAGDTEGNLWKFDLRTMTGEEDGGDEPGKVAYNDGSNDFPLVRVTGVDEDNNSTTLMIQTRPIVSILKDGRTIVIFGTGRLFGEDDALANYGDSLFGIVDTIRDCDVYACDEVQEDQFESGYGIYYPPTAATDSSFVLNTYTAITVAGSNARKLSEGSDPNAARGWRIALDPKERIITQLNLRNKRVTFTSITPTIDEDEFTDNDNWLNGVDYATGGTPPAQFLDVDGDGDIDSGDLAGGEIPFSAFVGHGIASGPRTAHVEGGFDINLVTHGLARAAFVSPFNDLGLPGGHFDLDTFNRAASNDPEDKGNSNCYGSNIPDEDGKIDKKGCHTHEYDETLKTKVDKKTGVETTTGWQVDGVNMLHSLGVITDPPDVESATGILSEKHKSILELMQIEEADPAAFENDTTTEVYIHIANPNSIDTADRAHTRFLRGLQEDSTVAPHARMYFHCVDPDVPYDSGRIILDAPEFNELPQATRTCKVSNLTELRIKYLDINALRAATPSCIKDNERITDPLFVYNGINTDYRNGAITVQAYRTADDVVIYENSNYEHLGTKELIEADIPEGLGDLKVECFKANELYRAYKDPDYYTGGDVGVSDPDPIPDPDPNPNPPEPGPGEGGTEHSPTGKTITKGNVEDAVEISSQRVSWREVFQD